MFWSCIMFTEYITCIIILAFSNVTRKSPSVFLISLYGAPLAQRASYLALHSSHFGPDGTVNYDYIVTNSIKSLLIGSQDVFSMAHTNHHC